MVARTPSATYRLQFHGQVGFAEAAALVPYLKDLGISHLYASPLFRAREGSEHGYDIVDPTAIDPALGTQAEFDALVAALHENGMGLLLDIVPNHLAADAANRFWMDVLEHGRDSAYASLFDIGWRENTFLLPLLGGSLRARFRDGSLRLALGAVDGEVRKGLALFLEDSGLMFPLNAGSWPVLFGLGERVEPGNELHGPAPDPARERLVRLFEEAGVPLAASPIRVLPAFSGRLKRGLLRLYQHDPKVRSYLDRRLHLVRSDSRWGRALLFRALRTVPYRPVDAHCARTHYAYRRFFDINDLVGVRVEDEGVLAQTHELVVDLVATGKVDGLRVDHIDGLRDPLQYLVRLRRLLAGRGAGELYVIVEKILGPEENLRPAWPVDGSTGYDFISSMTEVFADARGLDAVEAIHARIAGEHVEFADLVYHGKKKVLDALFLGEFEFLAERLETLLAGLEPAPGFTEEELRDALAGITCSLPVYRTYIRGPDPDPADIRLVEQAVGAAGRRNPGSTAAARYIGNILSQRSFSPAVATRPDESLAFVLSWQQLTGPLAAKGVEDTALYRDTRLLSLDEVGGDVDVPEEPVARLHARNREILARWPGSLNASSTHDAKRTEDVRARLDVISEIPQEWERRLARWMALNEPRRGSLGGRTVPDPREEVFIYQSLLGIWPAEGLLPARRAELAGRLRSHLTKALREAKVHSDWRNPDEAYEARSGEFLTAILSDENLPFLADMEEFATAIAWFGALGSLAQLLLKVVSPGVPDFYQGTELWELTLTDPDNRRPVDFAHRARMLERLSGAGPARLLAGWQDGGIKLLVTERALRLRRTEPEVFARGDYLVLPAIGSARSSLLTIGRRLNGTWVVAAIPRLMVGRLGFDSRSYPGGDVWGDTAILMPEDGPRSWTDVLTGRGPIRSDPGAAGLECNGNPGGGRALPISELLTELPLALLVGRRGDGPRTDAEA